MIPETMVIKNGVPHSNTGLSIWTRPPKDFVLDLRKSHGKLDGFNGRLGVGKTGECDKMIILKSRFSRSGRDITTLT